ncbi:glycerol dehydrogenase [Paraburkholderia hospita]|uniref:Glycerol dehydrogenase n=2 Tax=Paraburkholderia hospita TaxID=169430 RepID=A0ABP2PFP7_9BURK|nr:glycerol dehydrogenase [Paraburkholderia hospita]OUL69153.1 glycerol dehydrogenase [Paraburkholderia hospita]OUL73348.1 glycerol dehydrogenase [Paraburkholderia hospita]OUL73574.1 glycerol dehydrogenase [Paraburkholderia hospita]SEI28060.1 glycerol dehydrogenase [Paraburkholderia hospita]
MLRTMGFPGQYLQGPKALLELGPLLRKMGFQRPLTLCDAIVGEKVWPLASGSMKAAGLEATHIVFPGECTRSAINALSEQAKAAAPDVIIGLGGGKTIDSAKGISLSLDVPVVICPTIASNDAPTSRLIVLYDETHRVAGVEYLKCNPAAVVVDTEIIAQAPARFFAAGIGDTVSKKFEAAQCKAANGNNSFGTPPLDTALLLANAAYETLIKHGPTAYRSIANGQLDDEVERVVEGTVLLSGVGFESGGLSLAHALIRGLTAVPTMASMLHGELVAFGTLVQLMVEERDDVEVAELLELLCAVNLPVTFAQLGQAATLNAEEMSTIVSATLAAAYSKNMNPPLTAGRLERALVKADATGASALQKRKW